MNDFTFQNTTKIYFGRNQINHLPEEIRKVSKNVLLVYGGNFLKKTGLYDKVINVLHPAGITTFDLDSVEPNPHHTTVNAGAKICRDNEIGAVLAIGGGSVIDAAKAIAATAVSDTEDVWDLVEAHQPIIKALPIFVIVTAAATGSEMDASAVISNDDKKEKKGIAGPGVRPTASFLNPENTFSVPAYQTACGSFDIMSHTIDTKYFSKDDKMDMLYRMMDEHILTVVKYAPIALKKPDDYEARANLMWAATWALNSFMTCGVHQATSVHAMEHELSGEYNITHGHGIAILMPRWMRYILNEETAPQIARLGYKVFDVPEETPVMQAADLTIKAMEDFAFVKLGLKSHLSELNIDESQFEKMAKNSCGEQGVIKGFVDLYPKDVEAIYRMCL